VGGGGGQSHEQGEQHPGKQSAGGHESWDTGAGGGLRCLPP
jgi:hypothetical protein